MSHLGSTARSKASFSPTFWKMKSKREAVLRPPLPRVRKTTEPKRKPALKNDKDVRASGSRALTMDKGGLKEELLTKKDQYAPVFHLMDVDLWEPSSSLKKNQARGVSVSSSSSQTTEVPRRARMRRRKRMSPDLVDGVMERTNFSLLEEKAVGEQTHKIYKEELSNFLSFARPLGLDVEKAESLDRMAVDYMNRLYVQGFPSVQGRPACGRHPPLLPGFWANGKFEVAKDVESSERLPEAVSRQIQIGLPASNLGCRCQPDERDGPAENGCVCYGGGFELRTPFRAFEDEGFLAGEAFSGNYQQLEPPLEPRGFAGKKQNRRLRRLDCLGFSLPPGLERPSVQPAEKSHPEDPLWDFDYNEYSRAFKKVTEHLGIDNLTPYQTRHSGPSIDRAKGYRTQLEVMKRGQWKSQSSVARYEKAARLAATFNSLPMELQSHARLCEEELGGIMLGPENQSRLEEVRSERLFHGSFFRQRRCFKSNPLLRF